MSVGRRRAAAAGAPAWHSTASVMAPTTAGMGRMRMQCGAVSTPGPGEVVLPTGPPTALRVCPGGAKPGRGASRVHPSCAPWLCGQRGKNHPKGFAEGSAHHRELPGSLCSPSLPSESFNFCSFEQGLCSWKAEVGQPTWERNTSLNLGTMYSMPTRDHSNNSRAGRWLGTGTPGGPHHGSLGHHWPWGGHALWPLG